MSWRNVGFYSVHDVYYSDSEEMFLDVKLSAFYWKYTCVGSYIFWKSC